MLRLYYSYDIPANNVLGKKIRQQYIGSFKVVKRIRRLAYRLDIPPEWRIYLVFTIAQLELYLDLVTNPFFRSRPTNPDAVNADRPDLP